MITGTDKTEHVSYLDHQGKYKGIFAWIFATDHKRIGLLYMYAIVAFFFVGVILGLLMRIELFAPGETIMKPQTYNGVFTVHGVIMIFMVVIPGLSAVFGNFFLPIHIGAKDVSFPKLNRFSWWLFMIGSVMAVLSQFLRNGPPDTGWTFYAPYSTTTGTNVIMATAAAFVLGFSSILTGLNFIVTIHRLRAPGRKADKNRDRQQPFAGNHQQCS
jgi:cytochrome c oxidase subunit 1